MRDLAPLDSELPTVGPVSRDAAPPPTPPVPLVPPVSAADAMPTVDPLADDAPPHRSKSDANFQLPPQPPDAPRIGGYHLLHKLGEGGMGVVWKAIQLTTRRPVALKLLAPAAFASEHTRLRFQREVELAARLEHPCIARVYDSGQTHPGSGSGSPGYAYYAMELIEGTDLETHVRSKGLTPRAILTLMHQVCLGVQHAHQRGVIHRDLKPSNIMVAVESHQDASTTKAGPEVFRRSGSSLYLQPDLHPAERASGPASSTHSPAPMSALPKVVDFGLAKTMLLDDSALTLSHAGQVAGTPAYMSPEQAAGLTDQIDTRTDVYALGVILYRLLTGKFPRDTTVDFITLLRSIREQDVVRPRSASADASKLIDRELETLLLKALERDADRRYDNAGALAADLDNYLHDRPLSARPASVSYVLRKTLERHRKPVAAASVGVLLLMGGGVGGAAWLHQRPVFLPVDSQPHGARLIVNGEVKEGCGLTPCGVSLSPGWHTIELDFPGHYQPQPRRVLVRWGQITGDAFEPIVLAPAFQTVILRTEPAGVPLTLRDAATQQIKFTVQSPDTVKLPRGRYTVASADPAFVVAKDFELLEIVGATEPLQLTVTMSAAE